MIRIAVIMTVFNRKDKTLSCLTALANQQTRLSLSVTVFITDDGSTDGTSDAVCKQFPNTNILRGDGNLFWNGGMRLSFAEAQKQSFDYYLWLNDDTILFSYTLDILISTSKVVGDGAIVVGATKEPSSGRVTYGGLRKTSKLHPLSISLVEPSDKPVEVDTMHGNCVLIPADIARAVGNLDPTFTHNLADYDYGFQAKKMGFAIFLCPDFVGICSRNSHEGTWVDYSKHWSERWKKMQSAKGIPFRQYAHFARKHAGLLWPLYSVTPFFRLFFPRPELRNIKLPPDKNGDK